MFKCSLIRMKFYRFAIVNHFGFFSNVLRTFFWKLFQIFCPPNIRRFLYKGCSKYYSEEISWDCLSKLFCRFSFKNWFRCTTFLFQIKFYKFALVNLFGFLFKCCFADVSFENCFTIFSRKISFADYLS